MVWSREAAGGRGLHHSQFCLYDVLRILLQSGMRASTTGAREVLSPRSPLSDSLILFWHIIQSKWTFGDCKQVFFKSS